MIYFNAKDEMHKFICIRDNDKSFILSAYHDKYCLRSIDILNISDFLHQLINGNSDLYNNTFDANLSTSIKSVHMNIISGTFLYLPISTLKHQLYKYLKFSEI
jgi:hypothetical protein